jgi:hypothetical protein
MCVTYIGDNNNISSNCNIDEVVEILSNCADCKIYPPTPTPTSSLTPTPTLTMTPTPTNLQVVYVYESCTPINATQTKNTQIIQTVKITTTTSDLLQNGLTAFGNSIFKDSQNRCWKYMGQKQINYIPPANVLPINYTGNYFGATFIASSIFTTCANCNFVPLVPVSVNTNLSS